MKKIVFLLSALVILGGCASKKNQNCGTKQQKKAKYHKMKSGKAPGGGMLN